VEVLQTIPPAHRRHRPRPGRAVGIALALALAGAQTLGAASASAAGSRHGATVLALTQGGGGSLVCVGAGGDSAVAATFAVEPSSGVTRGPSIWVTSERSGNPPLAPVAIASGRVGDAVDPGEPAQLVVGGAGGPFWVRTLGGALVAVDPRNRREVARFEPAAFPAHLAVHGRSLWVADEQGTVRRYDGRSGRPTDVVLQFAGADGEPAVIGATATNEAGDLWVAFSRDSVLVRVDADTDRVVDRIRYARPVDPSNEYRPATALAVAGRYAWIGMDDAAGTVDEPTLVRVDLQTGRVRTFTEPEGLQVAVIAATARDVWLGGDGIQHFDPATNKVVAASVSSDRVVGLYPRPCTAKVRAPRAGERTSGDVDPRSGPRASAGELASIDYTTLVATQLPPEYDIPPETEDLTGKPFRLVLCNKVVEGPAAYVAGLEYGRGGPEYSRQEVSGWPGDQANEIFDRARTIVEGCKRTTVRDTTFVPTAPPELPDGLGDEHLVLSRAVEGSTGLVFSDVLIRKGQFLYRANAETLLPVLAEQAAAALDRVEVAR
jgi:hypothetical protein